MQIGALAPECPVSLRDGLRRRLVRSASDLSTERPVLRYRVSVDPRVTAIGGKAGNRRFLRFHMTTVDRPVQCARCGEQLALDHNRPCPNCGAVGKRHNVSLDAILNFRGSLGWQHVREYYEKHPIILSTLIAITVGAPLLGLILAGWTGVTVALIVSVVSFFLGLRAITKVREIHHGSET